MADWTRAGGPRSGRARRPAVVALLVAIVVVVPVRSVASADATRPWSGSPHPRVLFGPGEEEDLRARLEREPYRTVFRQAHQRALGYDTRPLGDDTIVVQRDLSKAAKTFAFEYALDRTVVDGQIVAFPDAAARQAAGDRVRQLLLNLYPRSRLAVPAPLGGYDRDINTSEEIINYATAFDTLLGAGYDFGPDRAVVVDLLASVTGELHTNFVDPPSANGYADLMQNNHRSKSGAAMAVAGVVLADDVPEAADWFDDGVLLVDDVLRFMLTTGDGAYGEGPYYYRYTMQNLAPLIGAWDRFLGEDPWTARGIEVPAPHGTDLFRRTQRWMLDTTVPDGTMAPIDDGNPGRSYYFGVLPAELPTASAGYWRWADTPQAYETDGSVELGPDTIVAYDDAVVPAPPSWAPTQFYVEGGTATLRSAWDAGALATVVLGEHDTASEFGRDRDGRGRWPQSHEHAEPGSFLLHAFGERLVLDPGYLTFTTHQKVNKPEDHNVVLVDGRGPADYLQASLAWRHDVEARPPAEGHATLFDTLDGAGLDATSVVTEYRDTTVERRFLQVDDRYLVVADDVVGSGSSLTFPLHGNGGGTSGGTYEPTATGGRWAIGGARLDAAVGVVGQPPVLGEAIGIHEVPYGQERTHVTRTATVPTGSADAISLLYPTPAGAEPPAVDRVDGPTSTSLVLTDTAGDRRVTATRTAGSGAGATVLDEHLDGRLRALSADGVTQIGHGDLVVRSSEPASLSVRVDDGGVALAAPPTARVSTAGPATVDVEGLGFDPGRVDGACGVTRADGTVQLQLNRERRVDLRGAGGNARPAADAGPFQRVDPGTDVVLDGTASCDLEGSILRPSWELVSAPAGSAWSIGGTDTFHPVLRADRPGPYRVRLVVTDGQGARSLEQEVLVIAGPRCADGVDNDLDGLIDTDDAIDCDGVDPPPPTTTTTTTTSTAPSTTTTSTSSTTSTTAPSTTAAPDRDDPAPGPAPPAPAAVARPVAADPRFAG